MPMLVIANWKMNFSLNQAIDFCNKLNNTITNIAIVAAPTVYLSCLSERFKEITFASQDLSLESSDYGSFTGEISAKMLHDIGVRYSIIGHSERRTNNLESNNIVKRKSENAIKNNITPIICIGETKESRNKGSYLEYISKQYLESKPEYGKFILAYEPVWAIGTGNIPNTDELSEVFSFLENIIAKDVTLVYGGSVNLGNIGLITSVPHIGGLLLGKASLDVMEFNKIIESL